MGTPAASRLAALAVIGRAADTTATSAARTMKAMVGDRTKVTSRTMKAMVGDRRKATSVARTTKARVVDRSVARVKMAASATVDRSGSTGVVAAVAVAACTVVGLLGA